MWVILLTVVLVTPEGQPDMQQSRRVDTIEQCEREAHDWLMQDPHAAGGIGLAASCQRVEAPGEDG